MTPAWGQRPPVLWMRGGHWDGGITPLFSSDGQTMVSGANDNTIKVWRLSDNILLRTINPFDFGPYQASLSLAPNGQWMAATGHDNDGYKLKVFHTSDGSVISSYTLAAPPRHTAFSPDSQTVVADSIYNGSFTPVTFYPAAGGTPVPMVWYSGTTANLIGGYGVSYSPDSASVALWYQGVGGSGNLRVYPSTGPWTQNGYFDYGYGTGYADNKWSTSGFIGFAGAIYAVSAGCNPSCPNAAYSERGSGNWVAFSPDGTHFSTGLNSGSPSGTFWASLVNLMGGIWTRTAQISLEASPAGSEYSPWPAFSPDNGTLAVGTDIRIGLFKVSDGSFLNNVTSGSTYVYNTAYSPNGQMAASIADAVAGQPNLHLWNAQTGAQIAAVEDAAVCYNYAGCATDAVFSPDNSMLAVTGDGTLNLYSTADGSPIRSIPVSASGVAFSPDGGTLAVNGPTSTGTSSQFSLYRVSDGSLITSVPYSAGYGRVAYSYDGGFILSTSHNGVDKRDPTTLAVTQTIQPVGFTGAAALSPDSQTVAMVVSGSTVVVNLYRLSDGSLSGTLTAGAYTLRTIAFSPDGHYVVGGGDDSILYLWRVSDGVLVQSYNQETGYFAVGKNLLTATYAPDGTQIFYGRTDATRVMIANPLYLPFVESLTAPATIVGGSKAAATATLTAPATSPGIPITLTSNNAVAKPTPNITVPTGAASAKFAITAGLVSTPTPVVITATSGGRPVTASITVIPLVVSTLALSPTTVTGGASSTGTVTLNCTAPASGVKVSLVSGSPAAVVPGSVTVTGGSNSATFSITTTPMAAATPAYIQARYNGAKVTAKLTVIPPALAAITLNPTTVRGGQTTTANQVTLTGPAPSGGTTVALSSNKPSIAAVPSSVIVPAGATSMTFTITTQKVTAGTGVVISASAGGVRKSANLTVTR